MAEKMTDLRPDKIYVRLYGNDLSSLWDRTPDEKGYHTGFVEYIRKDMVEQIIRSSIGPQDALKKIKSL